MITLGAKFVCPHCGHEATFFGAPSEHNLYQIFHCDSETGGCEKPIAVHAQFSMRVSVAPVDFTEVAK